MLGSSFKALWITSSTVFSVSKIYFEMDSDFSPLSTPVYLTWLISTGLGKSKKNWLEIFFILSIILICSSLSLTESSSLIVLELSSWVAASDDSLNSFTSSLSLSDSELSKKSKILRSWGTVSYLFKKTYLSSARMYLSNNGRLF